MSQINEVVKLRTELDMTGFEKSLEEMKILADATMRTINNTFKSTSSISDNLSKAFSNIVEQSKLLSSAFEGIQVGAEIFQFAGESVIPFVKNFEQARLQVSLFSAENDIAKLTGEQLSNSLSLGEMAVGVLTGKVELATAAHAAWNVVKSIDPIMLVVAGVSALAAGLAFLCSNMDSSTKEHEELMEKMEQEKQAYEELREKQETQMNANLSEIGNIQALNNELGVLVDTNGKVKAGYEERAAFIVSELNKACDLNLEIIDGEIQGYSDVSSSIDDMIEKKRAEIILEAELPMYKEAVLKVTEAQIAANQLQSELSDLNTQKMVAEAELIAKHGEDWQNCVNISSSAMFREWEQLSRDTLLKEEEFNAQNDIVKGYYDDINKYETDAALIASDNAENYKKVQASTLASKEETISGKRSAITNEIDAEKSHLQYLNEEYAASYDEFEKKQLEAKIKGVEETIRLKQEEMDGMTSIIVTKGPAYDAEVKKMSLKALNDLKGDTTKYFGVTKDNVLEMVKGLNSKDEKVRTAAKEKAEIMLKELNSKDDEFSKTGADIIDGILNGANSKQDTLLTAMSNIGDSLLNTFKNKMMINSPSKKFAQLAKSIPEGIQSGIQAGKNNLLSEMEWLSNELLSAFETDVFSNIYDAIISEQLKMASLVQTEAKVELLKMNIIKAENQELHGKIDAVIENHVDLDGRELAVSLAPMISEELAFQWR